MVVTYHDIRWCFALETNILIHNDQGSSLPHRWSQCLPKSWSTITNRTLGTTCEPTITFRNKTPLQQLTIPPRDPYHIFRSEKHAKDANSPHKHISRRGINVNVKLWIWIMPSDCRVVCTVNDWFRHSGVRMGKTLYVFTRLLYHGPGSKIFFFFCFFFSKYYCDSVKDAVWGWGRWTERRASWDRKY